MPEEGEQDDDWDRNPEQPKKYASSHNFSPSVVKDNGAGSSKFWPNTQLICRCRGVERPALTQERSRVGGRWPVNPMRNRFRVSFAGRAFATHAGSQVGATF